MPDGADIIAQADQVSAALTTMAGVFGNYRASLILAGLSEEVAIEMVQTFHGAWCDAMFPGGDE